MSHILIVHPDQLCNRVSEDCIVGTEAGHLVRACCYRVWILALCDLDEQGAQCNTICGKGSMGANVWQNSFSIQNYA